MNLKGALLRKGARLLIACYLPHHYEMIPRNAAVVGGQFICHAGRIWLGASTVLD